MIAGIVTSAATTATWNRDATLFVGGIILGKLPSAPLLCIVSRR